ncbi:23S rRNA (uracil(1939)-C(5))-methyltransferase RlmD, partial [Bacteroidota bacterium]
DKRIEASCKHFGTCGGCKWQHMAYEDQLFYKQKQVEDNFQRIGKLDFKKINPIIPSNDEFFYRNKLEFTFSNYKWFTEPLKEDDEKQDRRALGFHLPGRFDKILDIEECLLQKDPSNSIRNTLRDFCIAQDYTFNDVRNWTGFLRNIIIRNTTTGETLVNLIVGEDKQEDIFKILKHLKDKHPEITSLYYTISEKRNPDISDQIVRHYEGKPYLSEKFEDTEYKIGPKSFFQTNPVQALKMYQIAREMADFKGEECVYDLYTGTGTIAIFIASKVKKVVGIEYVQESIDDAHLNASLNEAENTSFYAGDMSVILDDDLIQKEGKPDIIITDPPRAGMAEKVCQKILEILPEKIIYISCNPATQARDLAILCEKYKIEEIQPVDMFPQTSHVENIVKMVMR